MLRGAGRGPVTGVISWRATPGTQNDPAERATGITVAVGRFPGTRSAALIHEEDSRDFRLTGQSGSGQAQQRWLTSPERARRRDKARGIAGAPVAARQRPEAWFCVPGHAAQTIKPPPRWKQWLVSLVAVYPLVLLFQAFIAPPIKDWPLAAKSAVLPLCVLTLLTYVVMPPVSRLLRGWLHSSSRARRPGGVPVSTTPAPPLLGSALAVMVAGERLPAAGWAPPHPIAGCLAVLTAPLPRQGSHPPVPPAAVSGLALESTGYGKWPAGQARRPRTPRVK
jgi:uncharacterized protein